MSCHDIGAGMNSVAKDVLTLYDSNKISFEVARRLLQDLKKGVHWCDGNEYEAVECMSGERCGGCLTSGLPLEDAFAHFNCPYVGNRAKIIWDYGITHELCSKCMEKLGKQIGAFDE